MSEPSQAETIERLEREAVTWRAAQKACEDCDAITMQEVAELRAQLAEQAATIERLEKQINAMRNIVVARRVVELNSSDAPLYGVTLTARDYDNFIARSQPAGKEST